MSLFYGCIQNPILRTLKLVHHKQARGNNQRYAITCVAKNATNSAWKQFKGKLFQKLILLVCQCKKCMSNMTPNLFCKYHKQQVISNWKVWTVEARKELKPGIRYGNTAYNTVAAIQKSTTPYYKHIDNFPRLWPIQNGDTKYLMANYFFLSTVPWKWEYVAFLQPIDHFVISLIQAQNRSELSVSVKVRLYYATNCFLWC